MSWWPFSGTVVMCQLHVCQQSRRFVGQTVKFFGLKDNNRVKLMYFHNKKCLKIPLSKMCLAFVFVRCDLPRIIACHTAVIANLAKDCHEVKVIYMNYNHTHFF